MPSAQGPFDSGEQVQFSAVCKFAGPAALIAAAAMLPDHASFAGTGGFQVSRITINNALIASTVRYSHIESQLGYDNLNFHVNSVPPKFASATSSVDISDFLEDLSLQIELRRFSAIDLFLNNLDYSKLSNLALVSILRATFQWSDRLNNWKYGLACASGVVKSRGKNPERLFRGLI